VRAQSAGARQADGRDGRVQARAAQADRRCAGAAGDDDQIVGAERGKLTRESATIVERLGPDARHDSDPRAQDAQLLGELALVLVVTRKNDGDPLEEMR